MPSRNLVIVLASRLDKDGDNPFDKGEEGGGGGGRMGETRTGWVCLFVGCLLNVPATG